MLVTREKLAEVCTLFTADGEYGLDTETTGLRAYAGDRLFSLILSTEDTSYYFNFHTYADISDEFTLNKADTFALLSPAFENKNSTWYIANSKFDMSMLYVEGIELAGKIHDTELVGRFIYNADFKYGLGALAKRYGVEKSSAVEEYIKKHRLYTWTSSPAKAKKDKWPHYDQVPFNIIAPYGETDGEVVRYIGKSQEKEIEEIKSIGSDSYKEKVTRLLDNDSRLIKSCFDMEKIGIKINRAYCEENYRLQVAEAEKAADEFTKLSGILFKDSNKVLAEAFTIAGEDYPKTEKGTPSFKDDVLAGFSSPLAKLVQAYRSASKQANTYYANFMYYADNEDTVHANIKLASTVTSRFSYSDPNLQNIPRNDPDNPSGAQVRRAFIPRPDYCFVMIDYDQMEYRLMLDYARQMDVVGKILHEGLDVHQATANLMGVQRHPAKTLNFMLLYGGGAQKLAAGLGVSVAKAKELKKKYFAALPNVSNFINKVVEKAREGFVMNWAGRRYFFSDPNFAYKSPNHLIQGGCAEVVRFVIPRLASYLKPYKSRMLVQVHDEILFEVHKSELGIVNDLKDIMENTYEHKLLPLTCGVDHSWKSWGDKVSGAPS